MATPGPAIEPLASTSRQTALVRAAQALVTRSSLCSGPLPGQRAMVRSRSRSPSPLRLGSRRRVPRARGAAAAAEPDEHPRRQPPRGRAQLPVGGGGEVGEQRRGAVGIRGKQPGQRVLVELANARRDLLERRVPQRQLGPADAAPRAPPPLRSRRRLERDCPGAASRSALVRRLAVSFSLARRIRLGRPLAVAVSAVGAAASVGRATARPGSRPAPTPGSGRSRRRSGSGRTGPRASRPGRSRRTSAGSPRSRCRPVSSSTRSIDPRTDEPIRTSRWARVARVSPRPAPPAGRRAR